MAQRIPEEVVQQSRQQVVLGRVASLQDITEQQMTFCRAESITGQVLVIDGECQGACIEMSLLCFASRLRSGVRGKHHLVRWVIPR